MREGWRVVELKDVSEIDYGFTAKASFEGVGPKFLRITDIQEGTVNWEEVPTCAIDKAALSKHRLISDDIVFARTGATTGKSYLIQNPPEAVAASYLIRVRMHDNQIDPAFVSLYFQSEEYWEAIESGTTGSAQGGFNATKLRSLRLSIPPLDEQRRIVTILDAAFGGIDTAIANAEQNLANARALFESTLRSIYATHNSSHGTLPLGELMRIQSGYAFKSREFTETGHFLIRIGNVQDRYLSLEKPRYVALDDKTQRFELHEGDILISLTGNIGRAARVENQHLPAALNQRVARLVPNKRASAQYCFHFLCSPLFRERLAAAGHGTAQQNVSPSEIGRVPIPLPDLKEQERSAEQLDEALETTMAFQANHERKALLLGELKQSLLHKAFTGGLAASADPALNEAAAVAAE